MAVRGISKFAPLVNVDFFKELMQVLRGLIVREPTDKDGPKSLHWDTAGNVADIPNRSLCIVTTLSFFQIKFRVILQIFREALNVDLSDFVNHLYAIILPIHLESANIEAGNHTVAFAALSKRSLIASINWPPNITLLAPEFIKAFIAKDPKLEALLSTEDWSVDGI
ncbi:hypothetical protein PISMIDRAFT_9049 [Pisolithus microcarpus 441]|uniref:Uncharacterized protein n=1 Tax=Pisolithus microcarpus 441 TaxID=765257 RepID=A0A0C9YN49_9AGAM|nr:hypothetical protein PISMIDRAFT_9049 [Pisolithus microcarpus 441]